MQMWVPPDTEGVAPGYEQRDVNRELEKGGLRPIASGQGHEARSRSTRRDAVLWAGASSRARRPRAGRPHVHLFVAAGDVDLEDAASSPKGTRPASASAGAARLTAGPSGAEVLVWVTS